MQQTVQQRVAESIRVTKARGYDPHRFIAMWHANPTLEMLEGLIVSGEFQDGFKRLYRLDLLRYSAEQIVIEYSQKPEIIEVAQWRLDNVHRF